MRKKGSVVVADFLFVALTVSVFSVLSVVLSGLERL